MSRYRPLCRPESTWTLPSGLRWDFAENPAAFPINRPELPRSRFAYGVIETDRPLTKDEVAQFELEEVA